MLLVAATTYSQNPGTWQSRGSGIIARNRSMQGVSAVDSNTVWAITYDVTGATFSNEFSRTIDGGATWTSDTIDLQGPAFFMADIFASNKDTAWIAGYTEENGELYYTKDGGNTWTRQTGSFNEQETYLAGVHFFNNSEGFAYGGTLSRIKIWTTVNGGNTWEQVSESYLPLLLPPISVNDGVGFHYGSGHYEVIGDTIWFGNRSQRIWRSTDKGKTWQAFNMGARKINNIFTVAFKDSKNGMAATDQQRVFATHDGGETWYPLPSAPASITYYQIEHIPGSNGVYYATYEGSQQFYNDVRHIYTIDNGKTWIPISDPGVECLEFVSPNKAWGGGVVIDSINGGIYAWTGNMPILTTPDYAPVGVAEKLSLYTMTTPKQQKPLQWKHILSNTGKLTLTDIKLDFKVTKDGNTEQFQQTINSLASGATANFAFDYTPTAIGKYTFSVTASNTQLGTDFYKSPVQNFEVSDSIIAKDDGTAETGLGFGFGNPNWWGYYGSSFELNAPDTLTAITVFIARGSNYAGSINLLVNTFASDGRPSIELFHSPKIPLANYGINNLNPKLTYQLEKPLVLQAGKYVFAAGQDTLQGVIGFGFDLSNISADGFWLVSPVAGGGYPWAHAIRREHMMIRPHFKAKTATTSTRQLTAIASYLNIFPNPLTDQSLLEFELKNHTLPVDITVSDVLGRTLKSFRLKKPNAGINQIPLILDAPAGILLLTLRQGSEIQTVKLMKQ